MKRLIGLLLVSTLLFVGSCGGEPSDVATEGPALPVASEDLTEHSDVFVPIEEFPNQPHIDVVMSVVVGGELVVTFGSNPTTGFQWSENAVISDEGVVKQIAHNFIASGADVVGSPGQDVWTFEALRKGTVTIFLECSRPWEERDLEHWEATITVTVK